MFSSFVGAEEMKLMLVRRTLKFVRREVLELRVIDELI